MGNTLFYVVPKKQLQELSKLTYIEIDMAFKRIHGTTNEWEVSAYSSQAQKSKLNIYFLLIFYNY